MLLTDVVQCINSQFKTRDNQHFDEQSGIGFDADTEVKKIGYATNLTIEVIEAAHGANVNLIVTHHDAWSFIGDLKDKCTELLRKYEISHYFNHLPLDDADFGTNASLAKALGLSVVKKVNEEDGFMCGVIGAYSKPISFGDFQALCEDRLGEQVQAWRFNDRPIKKVHILCGAGHLTTDMATSLDENCDLYLTGEKILYTIEYAKLNNLNLVVGSHTFTEIFGVRGMLKLGTLEGIEVIDLGEDHLEAMGFSRN